MRLHSCLKCKKIPIDFVAGDILFWMTQKSSFWIHNEGNIIFSNIYTIKKWKHCLLGFYFYLFIGSNPGTILRTDYNLCKQTFRESIRRLILITEQN